MLHIQYAVLSVQMMLFRITGKVPLLGPVLFLILSAVSACLLGGTLGLLVTAVPQLDPGHMPHAFGILLSILLLCVFALLAWKAFETGLFLMLSFLNVVFGRRDAPARLEQAYAAKRTKVLQKLETA
ncbi:MULTISPECIES: hypothetical protein [Roseovarius]|uniref:Uncharacterized protein n=1 Tax=Roseovarius atlanticus TaxID=1641875 RepID=A0A0T5P067_9RHOB|nr:hypothetical protein [Roseovarius atlanticus]KRS14514.1 hypothetical protein XM53_02010 [Roseovarius atlanticus]